MKTSPNNSTTLYAVLFLIVLVSVLGVVAVKRNLTVDEGEFTAPGIKFRAKHIDTSDREAKSKEIHPSKGQTN